MFHFIKEMLVWQLIDDDLLIKKRLTIAEQKFIFDWKENAVKERNLMQTVKQNLKERY